jgi:hypothetical protein
MTPLLMPLITAASNAIVGLFKSDEDKARAKAELDKLGADVTLEMAKVQADLLKADINGNELQRAWRPILMLVFGAVLAAILTINFVVFPIMNIFGKIPPFIVMPEEIWDLLNLIMGGCVIGRTSEKIVTTLRRK